MRHFIIIANWKMYGGPSDAHIIATGIRNELEHLEAVEVVLCPPAIWLTEVAKIIHSQLGHINLGIQNIHDQEEGAYTGEISAKMAAYVAQYAIVGHSERVDHFREGSEFINSKIHAALRVGLIPVVCIGEREKNERSKGCLVERLFKLLDGVDQSNFSRLVVAYEPVWAVGALKAETPENAQEVAAYLKSHVSKDLRVIYGGSVNVQNVAGFLAQPDIEGALVGRASLKIKDFVTICRQAEEIAKQAA